MPDNIERIRDELPFICASVERVFHEGRKDKSYEFGKKKKGKKDEKKQERQSESPEQEIIVNTHSMEQGEHDIMPVDEDRRGSIIDVEI